MIDIEVSQETTDRLHDILAGIENAEVRVLKPALSRGLSAGKTEYNRQIKAVYNIEPNKLAARYGKIGYQNVSTDGDRIVGSIIFSGGVIPLYKFEVSPTEAEYGKGRKKVKATVMRGGGGETFTNAFIAEMPSNHIGVFERKGAWRRKTRSTEDNRNTGNNEKIKELFGPSLSRMAENAVVIPNVEERVNEVINKRIFHEIDRILQSGG